MVSMKDIAAACGVSVATVSKALNNHSDIGEETKQHIKEVAKDNKVEIVENKPQIADEYPVIERCTKQ